MNIKIKFLYEEFIDINLKYSSHIFDFIDKYCPIALKKRRSAMYEKMKDFKPKNSKDLEKKKERVLKNLNLNDFKKSITEFYECSRCNLCKRNVFREKRNFLRDLQDKILFKNIWDEDRKKILNDLINNMGRFYFKMINNSQGKFLLQKGDTLLQVILFNFIENISLKINQLKELKNEYFRQIAKLLGVNFDFKEVVGRILSIYYKSVEYEGYTIYDFKKGIFKTMNRFNVDKFNRWQKEIIDLRKKFNLTKRWESYIIQKILRFPIDDDGELIAPECKLVLSLPDGSPGIIKSITKNGELPPRLFLVGDEKKEEVKRVARKYNIDGVGYKRTKTYKQPLRNFNKNFRWYKAYQDKLKNRCTGTKESIFFEIFQDDILIHLEDWQSLDYKKYYEVEKGLSKKTLSDEKKEQIEIRGLNRIRRIIYELEKIVYKREK